MAFKEPLKAPLDGFAPGVWHGASLQQVTAVFVSDRQRFASAVPRPPPALKIHRPDLVDPLGLSASAYEREQKPILDAPELSLAAASQIRYARLHL